MCVVHILPIIHVLVFLIFKFAFFIHPVYFKNNPIGAICCRKEELPMNETRVYIMTLGILSDYRRKGLASCLLNYILQQTYLDVSIRCYALHVHVENEHAIDFYKRHGFHVQERLYGYYASNIKHLYKDFKIYFY